MDTYFKFKLSIELCCALLWAACLAWKDSEKTHTTLVFLSLSLMRDSLTVLSECAEYQLCKKQAIQTEYMITHCLEGIQEPSCACINSSWADTVNLANAKGLYEMKLVKPWKEYECFFALLLWMPEKWFQWGWSSALAFGLFSQGCSGRRAVLRPSVSSRRCHQEGCYCVSLQPEPLLLYPHRHMRRQKFHLCLGWTNKVQGKSSCFGGVFL